MKKSLLFYDKPKWHILMLFSVPNFAKGETGSPSAFPHRASVSDHLGGPLCWTCSPVSIQFIMYWGVSKLDTVLQMWSTESDPSLWSCKIFFLLGCMTLHLSLNSARFLLACSSSLARSLSGSPALGHVDWPPWGHLRSWLCCLLQAIHKDV